MSFRCQDCQTAFPNKERPNLYSPERVVTKTQPRSEGGPGSDIVEEKNLCTGCAAKRKVGSW